MTPAVASMERAAWCGQESPISCSQRNKINTPKSHAHTIHANLNFPALAVLRTLSLPHRHKETHRSGAEVLDVVHPTARDVTVTLALAQPSTARTQAPSSRRPASPLEHMFAHTEPLQRGESGGVDTDEMDNIMKVSAGNPLSPGYQAGISISVPPNHTYSTKTNEDIHTHEHDH